MFSVFWFFTVIREDKSACSKWKLWGNLKMLSCFYLESKDWNPFRKTGESYRLGSKNETSEKHLWYLFLLSGQFLQRWIADISIVSLVQSERKLSNSAKLFVPWWAVLLWQAGKQVLVTDLGGTLSLHPLQVTVFVWERWWPRWSFSSSSAAYYINSSSLYQKDLRKSTQTLSLGAPWNPIHTSSVQFRARLLSVRDLRGTDTDLVVCWYLCSFMVLIFSSNSVQTYLCCVICLRSQPWKILWFSYVWKVSVFFFCCVTNEINIDNYCTV